MANQFFPSAAYIQQFVGKSAVEVYLYTDTYKEIVLEDFRSLPDARTADTLFSQYAFSRILAESPSAQIDAWEHILGIMESDNTDRYQDLHKGTPFYFMGMASYNCDDFEKALFYMDAALDEDLRSDKDEWSLRPAGKFVLLDTENRNHAAISLVDRTRKEFEKVMTAVASAGGLELTIEEFRNNLVRPAMVPASGKRSAVTALLSFLLEFSSRAKELSLARGKTGTGEPFFLHLFKGALLFETLLKTSTAGLAIQSTNQKATLDKLLKDPSIYSAFGFTSPPQGLGGDTFDDVLIAIKSDRNTTNDFNKRAVRVTWGIRNKTGHSMAWPYRPQLNEYEEVYQLIVGAISTTLAKLH
jgi:hypothetical protein